MRRVSAIVWGIGSVAAGFVCAGARPSWGQGLEHYAPPRPEPGVVGRIRIVPPSVTADDQSTGAVLTAVVVVGDESQVYFATQSKAARIKPSWQALVGQPITPRLIARIEADLSEHYAARGLAVVVRAEPNRELAGIVRVRVDPVVVGKLGFTGKDHHQSAFIQSRLGVRTGERLDSQHFAYDLAALNRYPFRQVDAVFRPGQADGATDVDLAVTYARPWEVYAGFKYSGSEDLTMRRYVVGGTVGNLLGRDSVLSVQVVASPDMALHHARHPKFKDMTASYSLPVARHNQVEASLEVGELNFRFAPSVYRFVDVMATAGVRNDIAQFKRPGFAADMRFGVEAKNEQQTVFTGGVQSLQNSSEVLQFYAGYHSTHEGSGTRGELDVVAHISPGELDPGNSSAQARLYSDGRVRSARYAYVNFSYDHSRSLTKRLAWHSVVTGQVATAALPFSEQGGIGSASLVRGYFFIDGTYDSTLIVRNELSLRRKTEGTVSPYAFFDAGIGRDIGLRRTDTVASCGLGANLHVFGKSTLRLEGVHTLRQGQFTRPATNAVMANLMFKY